MRGRAAVALVVGLLAAGCGPKIPAHAEVGRPDAPDTNYARGPDVELRLAHARSDTDGRLAVELAVRNRGTQDIPAGAIQAEFVDVDGNHHAPLRAAAAPIAAGSDGTARFDFDLAFAAEGDGSLRVSGLPDPTDPIRMEWVKRVPPPPPDVHADEIARKIFVGIGVSILVIGYLALKIWAAQ